MIINAASGNAIPVNLSILRWARESACLSLVDAAARAKIPPLKQKNLEPADRLRLIETGKEPVTEGILSRLSTAYRLPEIVFFLSSPPRKDQELIDFRTVGSKAPDPDSPEFAALKRRIINLHNTLRDIALENGDEPVSFVRSVPQPITSDALAAKITEFFGGNPCETLHGTKEKKLFDALRDQAQSRGVYVCQIGDLGHHSSKVGADEFQGMVISEPVAPLIVINPNDTEKANVFSLVHEFGHLLLGMTGISGTGNSIHCRDTEKLCNAAAAEYLIPAEKCRKLLPAVAEEKDITEMARHFMVSDTAAARRALDLGMIDASMYQTITLRSVSPATKIRTGKPDPNIVVKYRLGGKIAQTVFDAAVNGLISFGTAASLLGISISRLEKLCS